MANVKISDLTAAASASATQQFEVNESGTSKRVTGSQVAAYALSTMDSGDVSGAGGALTANNLSDLANAGTARTNLGLGSIATQDSTSVNIDGGAIDGTPIGASSASTGSFTTLAISSSVSGNAIATQAEAQAGTNNDQIMTPLRTSQAIAALVSAGWEYVSTATASNSASITFSGLNFDAYEYAIQCYNFRPATDGSRLYFYNSSNGSTFYQATYTNMYGSTIWGVGLTGSLDNVAGNETQFCMELQEIDNRLVTQTVGHLMDQYGGSHYSFMSATTVNSNSYTNTVAVRFAMSAGNIATGTFKLNRQPRKPYS